MPKKKKLSRDISQDEQFFGYTKEEIFYMSKL